MKIVIIGAGTMGSTYAQSFLRSHVAERRDLMLLERDARRAAALADRDIGRVYTNPAACIPNSELIVLAVKPQDSPEVLTMLREYIEESQVILSIMAGITMKRIGDASGAHRIVRAMPNVPSLVGRGMTVYTCTQQVSRHQIGLLQNLLATTGKVMYVERENMLDAATAISGSGPAYVYCIMRALMAEAQTLGFTESEAELLVAQTFAGSLDLYEANDYTCEEWIDRVSSRGGTTEAAIRYFNSNKLSDILRGGVQQALLRARELGT